MKVLETISCGNFAFRVVHYGLSYNGLRLEFMVYRKKPYPYVSGFTVYGDYSMSVDSVDEGIAKIPEMLASKKVQEVLSW